MTNNINEQIDQNLELPTEEQQDTNQPLAVPLEPSTPATHKRNFTSKYPHLWKYVTTGVLSFVAGMLVFSFASSITAQHPKHNKAFEQGQQMPMKQNRKDGKKQQSTETQPEQPTQPTQNNTSV